MKKNPLLDDQDYQHLLVEIQQRIRSAQYQALKAVNHELISLYWDIGRLIVDRQQTAGWGKAVVQQLANDIGVEFPGISGFSTANLWRMRLFYTTYAENEKLAPMVREIGWTHNLMILEKCKDDLEREYYLRMTRRFGWTKNVLVHHIESQSYERTMLSQTNFDQTLPDKIKNRAKLAIKDEYIFDFLELGEDYSERQLEQGLVDRIEPFLVEMGGMFAFVGRQYRLIVSDQEYFLDLLLYHRGLKCLVAIELKIGEFLPEYVGKMQFYLAVLDDTVKMPDENPAIGIILCKSKNRTIVEYALRESSKPIGVAAYQVFKALPQELQNQLPNPEQIAKLLDGMELE
jgi:predicted nuclease of restriction endonuclease-like (RecB) superfamily